MEVALDTCRKVFVERDYSRGLAVRFNKEFPPALEGIVSRADWEQTIETINVEFFKAEKVSLASTVETLSGICTCYLIRLIVPTRYERQLAKIHDYIERQNKHVFLPVGLHLTDPIERGLRIIEVSILTTGKTTACNDGLHHEDNFGTTTENVGADEKLSCDNSPHPLSVPYSFPHPPLSQSPPAATAATSVTFTNNSVKSKKPTKATEVTIAVEEV